MEQTEPNQIKKRVGRNVFATVPKISVVIPAYACAQFIEETLDSVVGQKFREHEIIVVNDGSPDTPALERALRRHMDHITYIRQRNAGAGPARNLGIENARGDVIAFLDGDDVWMPDFLASQYVYMMREQLDMVYCDAVLTGLNSAYRRTFMEGAPSDGECTFNALLDLKCNVITSGTMARKRAIMRAGMFERERVRAHDFHLWLRMAKTGAKIGYQRKQLLKYRVHLESLSGDAVSRVERERDAFERVRQTIELDPIQEEIVSRRLAGLEADLAVEQGKSYLLSRDFAEAAIAFRVANRYRKSLKLTGIAWLARVAPETLLKYYCAHRREELPLVRRHA
jgi:glycosyltransferase involved in cell wall biosynthesis